MTFQDATLRRWILGIPLAVMALYTMQSWFLVSRRVLPDLEDEGLPFSSGGEGMGIMFLIPYLAVYAMAGSALLFYLYQRRATSGKMYLLWGLVASVFWIPCLIDYFLGTGINVVYFMGPVVLFSVFILGPEDKDWFLSFVRKICLVYVYTNVAYAILWFEYATIDECNLCILGPIRLYGLATHANTLAVIPILFLSLDLATGKRWSGIRLIHWVSALGIVIMAQSKTPLAALMLGAAVISVMRTRGLTRWMTVCALGLAATILLAVWFLVLPTSGAANFYESAATLTGRTQIWAFVVDMWNENKLGYGTTFFSFQSGTSVQFYVRSGFALNSAHSQYLTSLGQGGTLGLIGLAAYLTAALAIILRSRSEVKEPAMFLFVIIVVWGITEAVLTTPIISEKYFLHFVFFALVYFMVSESRDGQRAAASPDYISSGNDRIGNAL